MNVLLVAPQPFYIERGTPIAVRMMLETLASAGHHVMCLTFHEGEDIPLPAGVRISRISPPGFVRNVPIGFSFKKLVCDVFLIVKMLRLIRRERYDVIHAVEEAIFPAVLLRRRYKIVYDMDSALADQMIEKWQGLRLLRWPLNALEGFAVRRADAVMPICSYLAEKAYGHAPNAAICLLHDVPLEAADPDTAGMAVDLRQTYNIDGPLALYVGNLEHYQGVDLVVEAFSHFECTAGIHCVVVGGMASQVDTYRAAIESAGLGDVIHFTGAQPVDMLQQYLEQADLLLSPRIKGVNTPMKIYSYMLSGKPIVATDIPSHTQVLDGECAMLAPPDPKALAEAMLRVACDPELAARLGAKAREKARTEFSAESFRTKVIAAYQRLEQKITQGA